MFNLYDVHWYGRYCICSICVMYTCMVDVCVRKLIFFAFMCLVTWLQWRIIIPVVAAKGQLYPNFLLGREHYPWKLKCILLFIQSIEIHFMLYTIMTYYTDIHCIVRPHQEKVEVAGPACTKIFEFPNSNFDFFSKNTCSKFPVGAWHDIAVHVYLSC